MSEFQTILIVDDSAVYRELISVLMVPHCQRVLTASTALEAIAEIDANPNLEVVICDVMLGADDGFDILRHVHGLSAPKPRILMVSASCDSERVERAERMGAAGFLTKPTGVTHIMQALRRAPEKVSPERRDRWRCVGQASFLDPGNESGLFVWPLYNLSASGAFLETKGPLRLDERIFEFMIELGGRKGRVRARVVRVQEPSWLYPGGVGVKFVECSPEAEAAIGESIEVASP